MESEDVNDLCFFKKKKQQIVVIKSNSSKWKNMLRQRYDSNTQWNWRTVELESCYFQVYGKKVQVNILSIFMIWLMSKFSNFYILMIIKPPGDIARIEILMATDS